jgi:hypothetical protein
MRSKSSRIIASWCLVIAAFTTTSCSFPKFYPPSSNQLAVGTPEDPAGPIDIALSPPGSLNFKSKAEILKIRSQAVSRFRNLLRKPYKPTMAIFDQIEDHRPWWGMQGTFIWGAGSRSIEGEAEESRFLLNPFLLVGANSGTALIWNKDKITEADLHDEAFPYCWLPESLHFYPVDSLVQATYNITSFNKELTKRKDKLTASVDGTMKFGLIAYNARDLGFNFIYLDPTKSMNITSKHKSNRPTLIIQMIHRGGSCQYPGGCNNMSPAQPEIDEFDCSKLPARAHISLWKDPPISKDSKPDLTYFIDLR